LRELFSLLFSRQKKVRGHQNKLKTFKKVTIEKPNLHVERTKESS
jgi:hypothetical protein